MGGGTVELGTAKWTLCSDTATRGADIAVVCESVQKSETTNGVHTREGAMEASSIDEGQHIDNTLLDW